MAETLEQRLNKSFLYLERLKPETQAVIAAQLEKAQEEILKLISTTKNQAKLKAEINQLLNEAFSSFETVFEQDIENISELSWNVTGNIMLAYTTKKAFDKWVDVPRETRASILNPNTTYQGYTLQEHLKHVNYTTTRKIQGLIVDGFDKGQGIDEITRNIRNTFGVVERNQLNTLTRTVLLENIEKSQLELFNTEFKNEIEDYYYSSVIDTRRTPYCTEAHGYTTKDIKTAKYQTKTHYRCRSIWIPRTSLSKDIEAENQRLVQWDGKTVNHRDGTKSTKFKVDSVKRIPKNAKGLETFKYFDEKFQKDYLGATRYKLWKDGKASLNEMFDISRNRLIPIQELRSKL